MTPGLEGISEPYGQIQAGPVALDTQDVLRARPLAQRPAQRFETDRPAVRRQDDVAAFEPGFGKPPTGLEDVTRLPVLLAGLRSRGYSDSDVAKVSGRNFVDLWQATARS